MNRFIKGGLAALAAVGLMFTLSACDEDTALAVPQNFCGFVQGNGGLDNDRNVNTADVQKVLYQGQSQSYKSDQATGYVFPCNTRNYVVAPENLSADTHAPLNGRTAGTPANPTGTPISAFVTAYWQPNQAPAPLKDFIAFCQGKYGCAATDASAFNGTSNNQNASTPGWNKMLGENMYPVLQRVFETAARTVDDSVWQAQDPGKREAIAQEMSDRFAEEFQKTTGSTNDIICGSGSTGAGTEQFDCKQIYIVVDGVWASQGTTQTDVDAATAAAAKRKLDEDAKQADIDLTNAKYGPLATAYRACRDLNAQQAGSCKFITGPGGAQIAVP